MLQLKYVSLLLLLTVPVSCNLDTTPYSEVEADIALSTPENAEKVLTGAWSYMFEPELSVFKLANHGWSFTLLTSESMGNDIVVLPTYAYSERYKFNDISQSNSLSTYTFWTIAYKVIDNCNSILSCIDGLPGDATLKQRVKAQAYGLRGYVYLSLASSYQLSVKYNPDALCVPIYTEPTTSDTRGKSRSTTRQVYQRAIDDLENAYSLLQDSYKRNMKHKIDKNVAAGILARAYLYTGQWERAAAYANEATKGYPLMSQEEYLSSGFNSFENKEWIWGVGQNATNSIAAYMLDYLDVSSNYAGYQSFMADPYFMDLFDTNDTRYKLFEWNSSGELMYKKFRMKSTLYGDIVLMRTAEMLLIQAEAFAENDMPDKAIEKLNELRAARGANTPDLSAKSKNELVNEILIERRKELFGEGFALTDIIRRQLSVVRKEVVLGDKVTVSKGGQLISVQKVGHSVLNFPDGSAFKPNSSYYLFALPSKEISRNPNL